MNANENAALEVLTLDLGGHVFALEVAHVRQILDLAPVTEVPTASPFVNGLVNVRGQIAPVADLRCKFGMEPRPATIDTRIVVIEVEVDGVQTMIGLLADKVYEVTELTPAALEETPKIGTVWRREFIRCIGKRAGDFIIVLNIGAVFSCPHEAKQDFEGDAAGRTAA